ncbi:ABC transporter permease subunit [symbiont of Argiope bruennichi]|uniref:PstA family ABC transporter permease n=1 Tax=symbiont of Argiope bruennichi TaxID=2810479 RepID=UPI003DA4779A
MKINQKKINFEKIRSTYKLKNQIYSCFGYIFLFVSIFITLGFVFWIIATIIFKGIPNFHFWMLWTDYNPNDLHNSGVFPFLVTTFMLLFFTLLIAIPLAIIFALCLSEYLNKKKKKKILFVLNVFNSIPSLIIGIFGLWLFIFVLNITSNGFSILAAGLTMVFVVLPILTIGFYESFTKVPKIQKTSFLALGAKKYQLIFKIILPSCKNNLLSIVFLAMIRILGETAPTILTIGGSYFTPHSILDQGRTLSALIYLLFSESNDPFAQNFGYTAIFILIFFIIILNICQKGIIKYSNISEWKNLKNKSIVFLSLLKTFFKIFWHIFKSPKKKIN